MKVGIFSANLSASLLLINYIKKLGIHGNKRLCNHCCPLKMRGDADVGNE